MTHPNSPDKSTNANPQKLLDQVRDKLRVKHYNSYTEKTYVDWIERFIVRHGKRHSKNLGAHDVEAFLTHLRWQTKFSHPLKGEQMARPHSFLLYQAAS